MKENNNLRKIGLLFLFALAANCGSGKKFALKGEALGAKFRIEYYADKNPDLAERAEKVEREVIAAFAEIDNTLSTYRNDTEISRFNEASTEPFKASPLFYEVVEKGLQFGKKTDGAVDITVHNLSLVWGFGPDWKANAKMPEKSVISEAVANTGYWNVETFERGGEYFVQKKLPGVKIDVSSLAKGYTVDRVAQILESNGFTVYMINIGGEIRVGNAYFIDQYTKRLWKIGIEKPSETLDQTIQSTVNLENMAVATSGVYRNNIEIDGVEYSHLIDSRTGHPARNNIKSVTVLTDNCAAADAYATALSIMGERRAILFAEKNKLAVYLLVEKDGKLSEVSSAEFKKIAGLKT